VLQQAYDPLFAPTLSAQNAPKGATAGCIGSRNPGRKVDKCHDVFAKNARLHRPGFAGGYHRTRGMVQGPRRSWVLRLCPRISVSETLMQSELLALPICRNGPVGVAVPVKSRGKIA